MKHILIMCNPRLHCLGKYRTLSVVKLVRCIFNLKFLILMYAFIIGLFIATRMKQYIFKITKTEKDVVQKEQNFTSLISGDWKPSLCEKNADAFFSFLFFHYYFITLSFYRIVYYLSGILSFVELAVGR